MFFQNKSALIKANQDISTLTSLIGAIENNIPTISFTKDGKIISANSLFLDFMGYNIDEVIGQHHKIFCTEDYSSSNEYLEFWRSLRNKQAQKGTFP